MKSLYDSKKNNVEICSASKISKRNSIVQHRCKLAHLGWHLPNVAKALLDGEVFVQVAAGYCHTAVLTSSGRLLAWGGDENGQCSGVPALPDGERFVQVVAGSEHTAGLTYPSASYPVR